MKTLIMITDPIFYSLSFKMRHYLITQTNRRGFHTLPVAPAMTYPNADLQKKQIMLDNKGKAGIYRWINKENGKTYVGSAINLSTRLYVYYSLKRLINSKMAIYHALLKYGYSGFSLEILEYCEPWDVLRREQHYLDLLKPEYNIHPTAGSSIGYRHTEETKQAIRDALKGRQVSEETRGLQREARLGA